MPDPIASFNVTAASHNVLPILESTSQISEEARSVAIEAVAAIRDAGLSRMLAPKRYGGHELPVSDHIRSCTTLAHGCAAASWVHMVCGAHTFVVGRFPVPCQDEVFGDSPDVLIPGTLAPQGRVRKVADGWELSGRWQFGSGIDHGPWLLVGAQAENEEGQQAAPPLHLVLPASDVTVNDTWHMLGMRGTGSKDLIADKVFVPAHRAMPTRELFRGDFPGEVAPMYRLPVMGGLATMVAATVLGMSQKGFSHFVDVTRARLEAYSGQGKAGKPGIQMRTAESRGELELAEMLVGKNCALLDEAMLSPPPLPTEVTAQIRWNASYATELCRRATERLFAAGGAYAAHNNSPLQRWYRDVNTASHHAIVDFDAILEARGRVSLGLSAGAPL
ncbi:MAG: acyl-CoA dehydrogenase family protein [Burkholderiaceae bacterium]